MVTGRRKSSPAPRRRAARPSEPAVRSQLEAGEEEDAELVEEGAEPAEPALDELQALDLDEAPKPSALVSVAERGLARRDPLQQYMSEVSKHPLLSREEEHDLAVRYQATGDVAAAYRLVASNLRLVVKLAHEYHRNPFSLLDLVQEGNIGLMQAVKKYDPNRGVKLSSYAAWWIRAYILRHIMDNWKMVKLGTTEAQRKLFFKLRQEQERMISQGFEPTPKLLAARLNVTEQDVIEMDQRLGSDEVSLDMPLGEDGKGTRADRLAERGAVPADEALANAELKALFREKLGDFSRDLKDKDKFIFEKRLISDEPLTLQEIGDQYGVSRERARQIEAGLIGRIREYLRAHIPDFDLVAKPDN